MYTKTYFPNIKGICIGVTEIHAVVQSTERSCNLHVSYICELGFLKSIVGICAFIYICIVFYSVYIGMEFVPLVLVSIILLSKKITMI